MSSIVFNDGLVEIGSSSFDACHSLTSVFIPGSVRSIGERAFCGCISLQHVDIQGNKVEIGKDAFWNCLNLQSIKFSNIARVDAHKSLLELEKYLKSGTVRFKGE